MRGCAYLRNLFRCRTGGFRRRRDRSEPLRRRAGARPWAVRCGPFFSSFVLFFALPAKQIGTVVRIVAQSSHSNTHTHTHTQALTARAALRVRSTTTRLATFGAVKPVRFQPTSLLEDRRPFRCRLTVVDPFAFSVPTLLSIDAICVIQSTQ